MKSSFILPAFEDTIKSFIEIPASIRARVTAFIAVLLASYFNKFFIL